MAGNIIPAIATTNAIVAGMVVFQAVRVLAGQLATVREPNLQRSETAPIVSHNPSGPNPACPTSSEAYLVLACDPARLTLGQVLRDVVRDPKGLAYGPEVKLSVYESGRLLNEPDYGDDDDERLDNEAKTLEQLGCGIGTWISIVDEEDEEDKYQTVSISVCKLCVLEPPSSPFRRESRADADRSFGRRDASDASSPFALPASLPTVAKVPPPPKPQPEATATVSSGAGNGILAADDDDDSDSDIEAFDATPPPSKAAAAAQEPNGIVGRKRSLSDDRPTAPAAKRIKGLDFAVNADDQIEIDMSDDE
jgi:ubiquitin-like 1-activating enzyme E1 B